MRASLLYRVAAVVLGLFAVGHLLGFAQIDPAWRIDDVIAAMRTHSFDADGFRRSYWDFYVALGYGGGLLLLFAAAVAWQLASLPAPMLARLRLVSWGLPLCFAGLTAVNAAHLFMLPIAFAGVATACLALAAWAGERAGPAGGRD